MDRMESTVRRSDVSEWPSSSKKLSVIEICRKFNIDMENDDRAKFFWNLQTDGKVIINDKVMDWLGYRAKENFNRKLCIIRLLKKYPHIKYSQIPDEKEPRKSYIQLDTVDFERLMMLMRTPGVVEFRELYALTRDIVTKYCEYERWYDTHSIESEDGSGRSAASELERQFNEERERLAEELQRAEDGRRIAEEERQVAEVERQLAEERSSCYESQLKTSVVVLREDIAPNVVPPPIHPAKRHRLGLFNTASEGEWYLMRRQFDSWKDAETCLVRRSMTLVRTWDDVSHTVDIGNTLKSKCRGLTWYAKGNTIRVPQEHRGDIEEKDIVNMIQDILSTENPAHRLANDNAAVLGVDLLDCVK